jgi:hypothetical protein
VPYHKRQLNCFQAISAVYPMGASVAAKAGFEEREKVRVERSHVHEGSELEQERIVEGVELWLAVRDMSMRSSSPVSDESTTATTSSGESGI